jgi:hypothetical protein
LEVHSFGLRISSTNSVPLSQTGTCGKELPNSDDVDVG